MNKVPFLPSSITNTVIGNLINDAAQHLTSTKAPMVLGTVFDAQRSDIDLKTVVWGFTRDKSMLLLEVVINGVSINKLVLKRFSNGGYRITSNPRFITDYKRLSNQAIAA